MSSFNIVFDYRFDTAGFFNDPQRRATLEAAANIWESSILDEFANIPVGISFTVTDPQTGTLNQQIVLTEEIDDLLIFAGTRSLTQAIGLGGFDGTNASGTIFRNRIQGSNFEPWVGTITFDSTPSFSKGTAAPWFFDSTPETADDIPADRTDFLSTALHEIGHVLGIGTSDIFEQLGQSGSFVGVNAQAAKGGVTVPLTSDRSHLEEGTLSQGQEVLMDPVINNGRILPTRLDLALLADIGYQIQDYNGFQFTSQGETPPIATAGADTIFGTDVADIIDGLGGHDMIQGEGGNDTLNGGLGNDLLFGQEGSDRLLGGEDNDQLQGGIDADFLDGGLGNDLLFGQEGEDAFFFAANSGRDQILDFEIGTEKIIIAPSLGFTSSLQVFNTFSRPFTNVTQFTLSSGNTIDVFHADNLNLSQTPLTAANFVIGNASPPINDDSSNITLALAQTIVSEDGTNNLIYTFTREGNLTNALTVNYTISGTATNGTDYTNIGTSVDFAANSATTTVIIDPTVDTIFESDETVALTLASGTGYTLGTTTAVTGTIINDKLTLDIDGNGQLEPSDYTLINLYASFGNDPNLFDVFLGNNADVLLGQGATRTTGDLLTDYLTAAENTFFDLDGNGTVESSDYTLLDLYSSFGADPQLLDIFLKQNRDVLLGQDATRTTGIELVNYLAPYSI
ncbi:Calx-beta domain-containing protein [Crocosphaera sp. XPORK-15E]|uniref:Calx-beta domain-containing protein n=1 Tax=Crocosphaera sp. XPORK-15E TaxID=3110247 RepID=UPI002B215C9E|nr:Calx-beta domain-containing protein [Crocosphaera sp. XPORK-15E]MEA5534475.1 Calx-beta domain-containing protein [Crocosphaera sp. XPORK-15E]